MATDIMLLDYSRKYNSFVLRCLLFSFLSPVIRLQEIRDVAQERGNHTSQVHDHEQGPAELALDGDTTTCAEPYDRYTRPRPKAWWMVDLGRQYAISNVTVHSSSHNQNANLLGYISVRVSDSRNVSEHTVADQCALWNRTFPAASWQTLVCHQIKRGRYVSIQRTRGDRTDLMKLCEVKVMGREPDEAPVPSANPPPLDVSTSSARLHVPTTTTITVAPLGLPDEQPNVVATTDSSATIRWKKIEGVPSDLAVYYQYVIEYKERVPSTWSEWLTRPSHDPSSDLYQELTLTGLIYNTKYRVRVQSYRVLGNRRDRTGVTEVVDLTTKCQAPDPPANVLIEREQSWNRIDLNISWQVPQLNDCRKITAVTIEYWPVTKPERTKKRVTTSGQTSFISLEPDKYVVKLTASNDGGLSTAVEVTSPYNTDCDHCSDSPCSNNKPCRQCQAGYQSVECRTPCNAERYGINCGTSCSPGCQNICGVTYGHCTCKKWWQGWRCTTEIQNLTVPTDRPTVSSVTTSSAVIQWKKITDVPADLSNHYEYAIEYRTGSESRVEWPTRQSHDPTQGEYQEATLTGLQHDTKYRVGVRSYRVLGNDKEITASTSEAEFDTNCPAPEKPKNLKVGVRKGSGEKLNLDLSWEAPQVFSDCREIVNIRVQYRFRLSSANDWVESSVLTAQQTLTTLSGLESNNYVIRVTFRNDGGLTSYAETATNYDTVCDRCSDEDCKTNETCKNCRAGFKPPECRDDCDAGDYGASCSEKCSQGCKDPCDRVFGTCICQEWWKGDKCTTKIRELRLSRDKPIPHSVDESSAVIRWKKIASVNPSLSVHYQYVIEYKEETSSSWVEWQTRPSHDPSPDQYQEATLTGLMYNTVYDVQVKSFRVLGGDREETGITRSGQFRTKCTAPSKPQNVTVSRQGTENTVSITWKKATISGCNKASYQILYRLRSASVGNWTVVDSNSSTSHALRLDSGNYDIRVRVTNDGNGSFGLSNFAEVPYAPRDKADGQTGLAIGLPIGLVIVIIAIVLAVLLRRRRARKARKDERSAPFEMLQSNDAGRTKGGVQNRNAATRAQTSSDTQLNPLLQGHTDAVKMPNNNAPPAAVQKRDTRIRLENLAAYIKNKENEKDGFSKEYKVLKKDLQYPCTEGAKPEHKLKKNRYTNTIAYDHTRVVLDLLEGDPNSSYVNASYVSGYPNIEREFIACQGPQNGTVNDMWRMLWQTGSRCIVMLTMLRENGKEKSLKYWPEKDKQWHAYADISVQTRQEEVFADYVLRNLEAKKGSETRKIQQFHFTSWVDCSAPEHAYPLLHFRRKVMALNSRQSGPLVVHCSAGVGRTGTFIAIDYLVKQARAEGHVDMLSCVEELRKQRPNMVQTSSQYVFVYKSILELYQIGDTAIPCDKLETRYRDLSSDEGTYANTSKLLEQFRMLGQRKIERRTDGMAALTPTNRPKNRCLKIIPCDQYRPLISPGEDGSDYINAVYIDSYRKKDMYVVTQTPLPETRGDFWRLVLEYDYHTIVTLESVTDSDESVAPYWPEVVGTQQECGSVAIELLGENTSQQLGLITRDFNVARTKSTNPLTKVKQFQLTTWNKKDGLTTNLQSDFLTLIDKVASWQAKSGNRPILVHCLNGASRSGLFCAADFLMDMVRTEQEVDVFYVVRQIRTNRSQLVDSLEQYEFLHELALTYMTQYDTYSNYKVSKTDSPNPNRRP